MKWYEKTQMTVSGQCDAVCDVKKIIDKLMKECSVGAHGVVYVKTGNGTKVLGNFDGDGLNPVETSEVESIDKGEDDE